MLSCCLHPELDKHLPLIDGWMHKRTWHRLSFLNSWKLKISRPTSEVKSKLKAKVEKFTLNEQTLNLSIQAK